MDLQRVPALGPTITALVYADAEQLIGVDQTLPLERAMIDSILFGASMIDSVADLLFQLYERLGLLLYRHSHDDDLGKSPFFSRIASIAICREFGGVEPERHPGIPKACRCYQRDAKPSVESPVSRSGRDVQLHSGQSSPAGYIPRMLRPAMGICTGATYSSAVWATASCGPPFMTSAI